MSLPAEQEVADANVVLLTAFRCAAPRRGLGSVLELQFCGSIRPGLWQLGADPLSARWVPGDVLTPGWSLNRKLLFRACGVGLAALFLQKNPHPFIAPSGF